MRTMRLSLVGTVILALLYGLGAAPLVVMAQVDELTATWVTGTSSPGEMLPPESMIEGPPNLVRGMGLTSTVDWSDPRLPAAMTTMVNIDEHPLEFGNAATWAQAHRLDGPDGAWVGVGYGAVFPEGEVGLILLTGEGAYEGLGAVLKVIPPDDGEVIYEGYLYDTGLPPLPAPIEPPGE
jgi:hypothetical protein